MDATLFWKLGAASGAAAVALGAFGAHGLKSRVPPELIVTWNTAAHYHLVHSLALLAAGASGSTLSGRLFAAGTLLFSGSLYALVLTGRRGLGAITPVGGLLLIAGWGALCATSAPSSAAVGAHGGKAA